MEYINRIELAGKIGIVKLSSVGDTRIASFSLATCYCYRNRQGEPIEEVTWHNVSAWEGPQCKDLDKLSKGDNVRVIGRIRTSRITASDGSERILSEVVAAKIERISADQQS